MIFYYLIAALTLFFLVFPFIEVILSFFNREIVPSETSLEVDFACIITAYKNIDITKPLVASLLKQSHHSFMIYLVADGCNLETWDIHDERLIVLSPTPPLNLKAKSIIHAVENYTRLHEYTVIFDADNLAHPDFLRIINKYAIAGHLAIQGRRTAKNLDTVYACADATGEFYKNYVERYLPPRLGSSSVISGSGMAIQTDLYNTYLNGSDIQGGKEKWKKMLQEDKILQNHLLDQNQRIVFAWDAVVYDEKVSTAQAVEIQRSRWLYSYFQNIPNAWRILKKGVIHFRFNQFWFGLLTIAPPLFIQVLLAVFLAFLGLWVAIDWTMILILGLILFSLNILWTLYLSKAPPQIWQALWSLPLFIFKQMTALVKMKNPNKNFKHSEHHQNITVEEVMKKHRNNE